MWLSKGDQFYFVVVVMMIGGPAGVVDYDDREIDFGFGFVILNLTLVAAVCGAVGDDGGGDAVAVAIGVDHSGGGGGGVGDSDFSVAGELLTEVTGWSLVALLAQLLPLWLLLFGSCSWRRAADDDAFDV